MKNSFESKIEILFGKLPRGISPEERYLRLIELGKQLPTMTPEEFQGQKQVPGCQSVLHLSLIKQEEALFFNGHSDALISKGLAALLIFAYSGESAPFILTTPPTFLKPLGIATTLSPQRTQGLTSIYQSMQKMALESSLKDLLHN